MENFDVASALVGAAVALMPYLYGFVKKYIAETETKVDDKILAAVVKAVKDAEKKPE